MKVILLKDVKNVGRKFEEVDVKKGYALNFLLPQELARTATNETLQALSQERERHEEMVKKQEEELTQKLESIGEAQVSITAKANEQGHLFAGIGKEEIARAFKESQDIDLDPRYIELEHVIKEVGEHEIPISIMDKEISLTLTVEAEQ